jgi:hypothetical protein
MGEGALSSEVKYLQRESDHSFHYSFRDYNVQNITSGTPIRLHDVALTHGDSFTFMCHEVRCELD